MKPWLQNTLAAVGGWLIGSVVNMTLVNLGPIVIPLPEGVDVSSMEGLQQSMHLMQPLNFLFPFLGHAVGTLVGAFCGAKWAASYRAGIAMGIAIFFGLGGIAAAGFLGGPAWFLALDLIVAYLPMGYLAAILAGGRSSVSSSAPG